MNFGEKLKQLRNQRELSQPELAEAAEIEQSYLSKLENGRSLPSPDVLNRLMIALNVSMEELLDSIDDADARNRLSNIPQVGAHLQATAAAQLRQRRTWLFASLLATGLGLAFVFAGMAALLFPSVNFEYEYGSVELVPKGENGQRYDSIGDYVSYVVGERIEHDSPDTVSFETLVYREEQKYGELKFSAYLLDSEFLGTRFHRDADASEDAILRAAGFEQGGSRLYQLNDRHTTSRPENGYLLFAGWLLVALGIAGLLQTLLYNIFAKSR